jgi:hypothetical protein
MNHDLPDNHRSGKHPPEGEDDPAATQAVAGPLARRLLGSQGGQTAPAQQPAPVPSTDAAANTESRYATLSLLDGTIVARLACDGSLGTAVIGRGSLSTIRIHDPFVHRVHADIRWDEGTRAHVITHGGGTNGTFVSLQRIDQPTRLIDGTRIRVGKTELIYRLVWYP